MTQDKTKPWERQAGESEKAFAAFEIYLHMEPKNRSFLGAYRLYKGVDNIRIVNHHHCKFAKDHNWKERVRAYDNRLVQVEQKAIEDEVTRSARWRTKNLKTFQDVGEALIQKALLMLRYPLEETSIEDGKKIIKPTKWTTKDAATMIRVGKELMCIAANISANKIDVEYSLPEDLKQIAKEFGVELSEVEDTFNMVRDRVLEVRGDKSN